MAAALLSGNGRLMPRKNGEQQVFKKKPRRASLDWHGPMLRKGRSHRPIGIKPYKEE
jgi:hypothetical protein